VSVVTVSDSTDSGLSWETIYGTCAIYSVLSTLTGNGTLTDKIGSPPWNVKVRVSSVTGGSYTIRFTSV
jgi:hypothetical protein